MKQEDKFIDTYFVMCHNDETKRKEKENCMKKVFTKGLSILLPTFATVMLSGCVTAPKEPFALPQEPQKNISVYVDNSYDVERQENAVDSYVWAINNTRSFKVEINPEPIKIDSLIMTKKRATADISCLNRVYFSKLVDHIFFVTHNYSYGDYTFEKLGRKIDFYAKNYSAVKLDDKSFEIKGFTSKKEAMDIFIQLMRSTYKDQSGFIYDVVNTPKFSKNISNEDWDFDTYLPGRGFRYDPVALDDENRLIIIPRILDYSLKNQFLNVLMAEGYNIVEKKEDAQLLIKTSFLYYGTKVDGELAFDRIIKKQNKEIAQVKKDDTAKETEHFANEAAWSSRAGNSNMAKGFVGIGAINIASKFLEGNKYDGYLVSYADISLNGKEILADTDYNKADANKIASPNYCEAELFSFSSARRFMFSYNQKQSTAK